MTGDEGLFSTIFRAILLCCFLMDNGYNIETCKIIGATSLSLHFCHMRDFFRSSKGGGAWPKWPNGKYAYDSVYNFEFLYNLVGFTNLFRVTLGPTKQKF